MARSTTTKTSRSNAPACSVALLRVINVGGKNKLPMTRLAAMFTEAGCSDVRTYIRSGNVLFSATPARAERLPELISRQIVKGFGFRAPVVLRTADELRRVPSANPFLKECADASALHVAFLADLPDKRRLAALDPKRSPGDSFKVRGRNIYLHLPGGVAGTKLTDDYFDSTLATTSTLRNWRTVLKLLEMMQEMG